MSKDKDQFFLRKVTQSQYRRHANDEDSEENPTYLNLSLQKVEISDKSQKDKLRAKIREQAALVVKAMVPEGLANTLIESEDYLKETMQRLGL